MSSTPANKEKFSYDEVPYDAFPYPHTHPDHMATIGALFNLSPAKLETARVLELGCGGGANILPLALRHPQAKFTGIDLSSGHIDAANAQKKALGLKNISFACENILDFDLKKHKGAFDYIVCHGVYSWVPAAVSERILELCRDCLSPNGLAVISYNTLPGWNAIRSLCEMMRFHSDRFTKPAEKVAEAKKLLQFLSETAPEGSGYKGIIEEEKKHLGGTNDSYFYHDHLEALNRQFYFHEFAGSLKKNGLAYVGDSTLPSMFVETLTPRALSALKALNDILLQEQYIDFVVNRRFRCSIICKEGVVPNRNMRAEQVMDFYLTANMRIEGENPDFTKPVKFSSRSGKSAFTTKNQLTGVVYNEILKSGAHPIAAKDVAANAAKILGVPVETASAALIENGLQLALRGFISLHMGSPAFAASIGAKPKVYPLALLQAARPECAAVTNLLCKTVPVKGLALAIIRLLDGTRKVDEVKELLVKDALAGKIALRNEKGVITDKKMIADKIGESLSTVLQQLAQNALLAA